MARRAVRDVTKVLDDKLNEHFSGARLVVDATGGERVRGRLVTLCTTAEHQIFREIFNKGHLGAQFVACLANTRK